MNRLALMRFALRAVDDWQFVPIRRSLGFTSTTSVGTARRTTAVSSR